jgi:mono/diheme cytochrome c family protein
MKHLMLMAAAALSIAAFPLLVHANRDAQPAAGQQPAQPAHASNTDRGQQVFAQNCSRCHNPPEGFSPRISKAVAMHMRVRANLSDADYKAVLHFLNP